MSINDPLVIEYLKRRSTFIVKQGRETFYDEDRCMIEFETIEKAEEWTERELGKKAQRPEGVFQLNLDLPSGKEENKEGFFCPKCGTVYSREIGEGCLGCNPKK